MQLTFTIPSLPLEAMKYLIMWREKRPIHLPTGYQGTIKFE